MRRALVMVVVCIANVAIAAPHSVLVLRSEGTADTASRTSVDTHVLRLAKNIDGKVDAGDVTLTEAGAMVGCNASEASCKNQVLDTLGVDEIVATTVTATPTGLNVTVRRIAKVGPPKAAQTTIPAGKAPDAKINADIGPMFGVSGATPTVEPPPVTEPKPAQPPKPTPPPPPPTTTAEPKPAQPAQPAPQQVTAAPNGTITQTTEGQPPRRRMQKIMMGAGGAFLLLGILMWSQASDIQSQIDDRPEPVSPADFQDLQDLEQKGDDIAGAGNVFFIAGVALAGTGGYLYWRAGRSSRTQTARIAPTVFPNGAGVTLTLGVGP